jgi:hypothetical protein
MGYSLLNPIEKQSFEGWMTTAHRLPFSPLSMLLLAPKSAEISARRIEQTYLTHPA